MNTGVHQYEDKLLDYAYGELPANEAAAVDAHVRTCAKCSQALAQIKGVRSVFAPLPMVAAPDAGLESLLAYADQHARRAKTAKQAPWRRWVFMFASAAALLVVGVVAVRAADEAPQSAADVVAAKEKAELQAERPAPVAAAPVQAMGGEQQVPADPAQQQVWDERTAKRGGLAESKPAEPALDRNVDTPKEGKKESNKLALAYQQEYAAKNDKAPAKPQPQKSLKTAEADSFDSLLGAGGKGAPQGSSALRKSESKREQGSAAGADLAGQVADYGNAGRAVKLEEAKAVAKDASKAPVADAKQKSNVDDQLNDGTVVSQSMGGTANRPTFGVSTGSVSDAPAEKKAQVARAESEVPAVGTRGPGSLAPPPPVQPSAMPSAPAAAQPAPMPVSKKSKGGYGLPRPAPQSADEDAPSMMNESIASSGDAEARRARDQQLNVDAQLVQARSSANAGDRRGEVAAAVRALNAGATGYSRAEALKRACDGLEALGEYDRAEPYCERLIAEFSGTAAARQVADRRKAQLKAPKAAPARESRQDLEKAADQQKQSDLPAAAH